MYNIAFKSIIDFFVSFVILVITAPILIIVTLFLLFANQGKPFFYQLRPGKNNKIFKIIKFKTMNDKKATDGKLLSDAERLTKIGNFVRKTSLDELPQLINVLKGEMSLIGPRPLLPEYLPLYNETQKKRHEVRPGITGWAQVNGRNAISWSQKFEFDVWYVNHVSFLLDCKILYLTVNKVFKREGINSENSVSAEAFNGKN
ncbi:sugar transferase [Flavobacterium sp.]|uniref:sugar transferase n=1 Tax=Flavobacterium sp. TaxID=239 RepID=UPI00334059F0